MVLVSILMGNMVFKGGIIFYLFLNENFTGAYKRVFEIEREGKKQGRFGSVAVTLELCFIDICCACRKRWVLVTLARWHNMLF